VTSFLNIQTGINFNYSRHAMNEFVVGGMTRLFRNQVIFAGLQEGTVYTPAMASVQGGLRTFLFTGAYLTGRANILFNNFISKTDFFDYEDIYTGYGLTFTYNFALGPLDLSLMYSDQTKKLQSYINLGIPF
jgi:NTE family protein